MESAAYKTTAPELLYYAVSEISSHHLQNAFRIGCTFLSSSSPPKPIKPV